ncbi:MAG: DUF2851 family protein [Dehalococcoidia bacterium]
MSDERAPVLASVEAPLAEAELTALWLLGRMPPELTPWPLLRAGRAGRGPGPDIREASFIRSGVPVCGDVEVHLRASDFVRHGHPDDSGYANVVLHLVWQDDRPPSLRGLPQALPGGSEAPTVEVGPALGHQPRRVRALLARGPSGGEPCALVGPALGPDEVVARVRLEGRRRLAERAWRAGALAVRDGWARAWTELLDHALRRSAGRHAEAPARRSELALAIGRRLGEPVQRELARRAGDRRELVEALTAGGVLGAARAHEVGWNAALPFLIAVAAAYEDAALARATAALAAEWPAPHPYGRTRALEALLRGDRGVTRAPVTRAPGALWSQGLLHLQDLWCTRGGCGACPLSVDVPVEAGAGVVTTA